MTRPVLSSATAETSIHARKSPQIARLPGMRMPGRSISESSMKAATTGHMKCETPRTHQTGVPKNRTYTGQAGSSRSLIGLDASSEHVGHPQHGVCANHASLHELRQVRPG